MEKQTVTVDQLRELRVGVSTLIDNNKRLREDLDDTRAALEQLERRSESGSRKPRNAPANPGPELSPDSILADGETYTSRARAQHGEDDARFGALLKLRCGLNVSDVRESEQRAMSTSSGAGGGFLVPHVTSGVVIDALVNRLRVNEAGAMRGVLPEEGGEFLWPKLSGRPATAWHADNDQLSESDMTFDGIKVEPRTLAVGPIKMPMKLLEQSAVNLERYAIDVMTRETAIEVDRAALFGLGTAKEPKGLIYHDGVNEKSMGANGAAITDYDPILDAIKLIEDDNGNDPTAALLAPRTDNTIAKWKTGTENLPLPRPKKIEDLPFLVTNQVPIDEEQGTASDASRILLGHYPDMTLFFQGPVRVLVLRERYAEFLQVGIIVFVRVDVMVAYPESFASVTGIVP